MAQLDKMSIMGIRSFNPKEQTMIKFYPVTLILGVNGAGKTTIIEALRFITSGDPPPGTNGGRTWVHDPQLQNHIGTIRAQLRLKFRPADGTDTKIFRSLELLTKKDKSGKVTQQFKTLDSVIKRGEGEDQITVLSSKCAEVDREMLNLMGVSKAVLTNVIFCHQEDNCWPLSEGKVLKEKFDQIFGSMGWVKALAKLKSIRASKMQHLKMLKAVVETKIEIRDNKKKMEKELSKIRDEMKVSKTMREQINEKLKPLKKELNNLVKEEEIFSKVRSAAAKIKGQLQVKTQSVKSLEGKLGDSIFTGTIEELDEKLESFESSVQSKTHELSQVKQRLTEVQNELRSNNSKKDAISKKRGKLEAQMESYKKAIAKKEAFIAEVRQSLDLDMMDADDDPEAALYAYLDEEIKRLEAIAKEATEKKEEEVQILAEKLNERRTEKTKAEQTMKMKQESQNKRDQEMKDVLKLVEKVEKSASSVSDGGDKVLEAVRDLKSKISDDSLTDPVESAISDLQISNSSLQDEVADLKKVYRGLQRETLSDVSEIKKELKELEREIIDIQSKLMEAKQTASQERRKGNDRLDSLRNYKMKLGHINDNLIENPLPSQKSSQEDIDQIEKLLNELESEKICLEDKKSKMQQETADQQLLLRNLIDNKDLLKQREEIAKLTTDLSNEESQLISKDYEVLQRKKTELDKKESRLNSEVNQIEGKLMELQKQVRKIEDDLSSPKYQKADADFKKAKIDVTTCEVLCDDMNKYYKILDKAVSTYHVRKMVEINQFIEHFWRITYQGNDIQSIKIACDDEHESAADKRKVYNYRVVMIRDGTEMDMRGRCSAGQKVLASLVIRIALAQIFALDCPILTLDEPTTNLDKRNIEALAKAIADIAEDQKDKLQMVIITHDTEFLKYMHSGMAEYYYEISKEDGYSQIKRLLFGEKD